LSSAAAETLTIERRLSAAQVKRRGRVRDAARALAEEGGYPAVTMDAVADRSGVARATIYRYFASKDHLLAEVTADWAASLIDELRARPPRGSSPARRVARAFRWILEVTAGHPRLTASIVASITSSEPEAVRAGARFGSILPSLLDVALGDADVSRRAEAERILGHVFFSVLVNTTTGRIPGDEGPAAIDAAADLLFPAEGA
jgi:AcrR family transcriptional regulator